MKNGLMIVAGLLIGLALGYILIFPAKTSFIPFIGEGKEVLGFLPYWLSDKAQIDYSKYITTLSYFDLVLSDDGHILKLNNPQEEEPGWFALSSGKMDNFLQGAKKNGVELSLTVFDGDNGSINSLISNPTSNAQNLTSDVLPIMKQYNFSQLNLDIESTKEASESAQENFTEFARTIKKNLATENIKLTVDVSPTDLIKPDLINPRDLESYADKVLLMTYDYHYISSSVTGPVAPLSGAGVVSEYDTETAVEKALQVLPADKILLGLPLYGYEWETLSEATASAIIPGTGLIASNQRVENFLNGCASCSATFDQTFKEPHIIYFDQDSQTFHQIFYPDQNSLSAKLDFAKKENLAGVGLWALGYEGKNILDPLKNYK